MSSWPNSNYIQPISCNVFTDHHFDCSKVNLQDLAFKSLFQLAERFLVSQFLHPSTLHYQHATYCLTHPSMETHLPHLSQLPKRRDDNTDPWCTGTINQAYSVFETTFHVHVFMPIIIILIAISIHHILCNFLDIAFFAVF